MNTCEIANTINLALDHLSNGFSELEKIQDLLVTMRHQVAELNSELTEGDEQ